LVAAQLFFTISLAAKPNNFLSEYHSTVSALTLNKFSLIPAITDSVLLKGYSHSRLVSIIEGCATGTVKPCCGETIETQL
jgi:hypothetical protein